MDKKNILIADQDITNLQYFFNYINHYPHYNIMNASSAAMALDIKKEKALELIVIDWLTVFNSELSLHDFWEILTEGGDIPLVLMTHSIADFMGSNHELSSYVKDIIRKPFNATALREIIDRHLKIPLNQFAYANSAAETESKPKLSREISLHRQKEIIDFEKEMMIAERINLHQLREELRKEIEQLEEERIALNEEKEDLLKQQTTFTEEENKLFTAQIQLQEDLRKLKHEKQAFEQAKSAFEQEKENYSLEKKS